MDFMNQNLENVEHANMWQGRKRKGANNRNINILVDGHVVFVMPIRKNQIS
jgi:hypothetical protein